MKCPTCAAPLTAPRCLICGVLPFDQHPRRRSVLMESKLVRLQKALIRAYADRADIARAENEGMVAKT